MRPVARPFMFAVLATVALLGGGVSTAASASASPAIRPHQHFIGLVNGAHGAKAKPVVYTVCPGPGAAGRTGPVAGGQTLAIARVAAGNGDTGLFNHVYAWFAQDSSPKGPVQVRFATYDTTRTIPSAVRVPCDGAGQVEFSSCPRLAPCAVGWVPNVVDVRFVNLAV